MLISVSFLLVLSCNTMPYTDLVQRSDIVISTKFLLQISLLNYWNCIFLSLSLQPCTHSLVGHLQNVFHPYHFPRTAASEG